MGREVHSCDDRPLPDPAQCVRADVALQVKEALASHVAHFPEFDLVENLAALTKELDLPVGPDMYTGHLVPERAVCVLGPTVLLRTYHGCVFGGHTVFHR